MFASTSLADCFIVDKLAELNFKTNQDGSVKVPEIPQGNILIQVVAKGWRTYGKWYDIETDEQSIPIKFRPSGDSLVLRPPLHTANVFLFWRFSSRQIFLPEGLEQQRTYESSLCKRVTAPDLCKEGKPCAGEDLDLHGAVFHTLFNRTVENFHKAFTNRERFETCMA